MIPIRLTIEGLYSYQQAQTIDFSQLTEAGLFGIFGAVGSGKSSILEAISFALYGKTERLNESGDARNYNMMNLRSVRSGIDFEFLNFENKKYRITRTFRRNSKRFEDVKPVDIVLYLWEGERWVPQSSSDVAEILDISYANFKRTIIIPQGQFKEFLELGATERTKMLKEIFNLQRFDLQTKVAACYAATKSDLDKLEGQLQGFEDISSAIIIEKQQKLSNIITSLLAEERECGNAEQLFLQMKHLKVDFENLHQKQLVFYKLDEEKPAKEALEKQMLLFESTQQVFAPLIRQMEQLKKEAQEKQSLSEKEVQHLTQLKTAASELKKQIDALKPSFDLLTQKRVEEQDLILIWQISQLKNDTISLTERQNKGAVFVNEATDLVNNLKNQILQNQENLLLKKAAKPDANQLLAVEKWYGRKASLKQKKDGIVLRLQGLAEEENTCLLNLGNNGINPRTYLSDFEILRHQIEQQITNLRQTLSQAELQEQLSQYVHVLHEGDPCPLCGALEHPDVIAVQDVSEMLTSIKSQIANLILDDKKIVEQREKGNQLVFLLKNVQRQKGQLEKEREEVELEIQRHLKGFLWQLFSSEDSIVFENQKQVLLEIENEIKTLETSLSQSNQVLLKEQENLDRARSRMEDLRLAYMQKEAQIVQNTQNVKRLSVQDYASYTMETLSAMISEWQQQILQIETDYHHFTTQLNTLLPQVAAQDAKLMAIQSRLSELAEMEMVNQQAIAQLLKTHQFIDIDEVKTILAQQIETARIKQELEIFKVQYQSLLQGIEELKVKLEGSSFDPVKYEEQEQSLSQLKENVRLIADTVAQLKAEVRRDEETLAKKQEVMQLYVETQKRFENLNTLKRLFDRAGFVEYVSTIYLRQLCDMANVRFHRLTRNQLSLQLNEGNDFEIIDYLNEGKKRSVKTLSGGQIFQVSLSLALALAESVQSNAKAEKNFFFIDEGFGTQDAASVNIVFETLMNLQKENRIVGIISHVDELKDKIPVSLSIEKDEERGSLIRNSWA